MHLVVNCITCTTLFRHNNIASKDHLFECSNHLHINFYRPQGKVMFSQGSVCPQELVSSPDRDPHLWTEGQRPPLWSEIPSDREPPWTETPLARDPLVLTSNGSHCSSRYASYWNAFLFHNAFLFTSPSMHNASLPFTNYDAIFGDNC